jgi:hypothetical protein
MFSAAIKSGSASTPKDPQFNYVTMLLHGDGTSGAQNNTFLDSSTNNFTVTRNGNTTQGTWSPYGSNWSNYIGSGNYLSTPATTNFNLTGNFTIECWLFMNVTGNNTFLSVGVNHSAFWYAMGVDPTTNTLSFSVNTPGNWNITNTYTTTSTVPVGVWTHIAAVKNGTNFSMYINGVSGYSTNSFAQPTGATGSVFVGTYFQNANNDDSFFHGYISNFRIVNGSAVYTSAFTPPIAPLTAITNTQLLTCQSNRFIDTSANNGAITLTGTPTVQRFSPFLSLLPYSTSNFGGSGYFDGTGDYLTVPSTSGQLGSGDFTIEAYIYPITRTNLFPTIWNNYSTYTTGSLAIFAGHNGGNTSKYQVSVNGAAFPTIQSTDSIVYNQWTHIAVVRNSGVITLYVNGVANGTYSISTALNGSNSTWIGSSGDELVNGCFNGYISNSRVVKGTAVYTSAFTPPTAPLTAITNTSLLLSYTNAGIFDNAMMNDLETVGNAQISTSVKKYGTGSMYFDGTGDYLYEPSTLNLTFGTNDFTVEMWVNPSSLSGTASFFIGMRPASTNGAYPVLYADNTGTYWYISSVNRISGSILSTNTWTHLAVCRSGTSTKMFINGTQTGSTYTDTNNYLMSRLYIAASDFNSGASEFLTGYIDDLRITKGYARYTANFTVPGFAFPNQ